MTNSWKLYTIALLLTLTGCASVEVGRDFNNHKFISAVQRGVTTQSEILQWLGEPASTGTQVETSGKQYTRWVYYFGTGKPPRFDDVHFKNLEVLFDDAKVVQGYQWSGGQ
ncbi:MAG: hypothetical protein AABY83_04815 [Pseudomonadota bacterium]